MPLHDFRCRCCGHVEERLVKVEDLDKQLHVDLDKHGEWGAPMDHVWRRAPMGFVQGDICYDSPVDGRPITTKQARIEDLRRNGCVEYDPGMKQDVLRRKAKEEADLDRSIDASVDQFFATAGGRKLEKLEQELRA